MKTKTARCSQVLWIVVTIAFALGILLAMPQTAAAQGPWLVSPSPTPTNNIYYNAGNVGIGTNAPDQKLVVSANSATTLPASPGIIQVFGANGAQPIAAIDGFAATPVYLLRRANNTAASPSAVQANDLMGAFGVAGYGSTAYQGTRARVGFFASENWTNSANGTYMVFNTTANGAASAGGIERMRIDNAGNVGIGTTSPGGRLDISQTVAATALLVQSSAAGDGARLDLKSTDTGGITWRLGSVGNVGGRIGNFEVQDLSANTVPFLIQKTTGYVGIGLPAPAYTLDVAGWIHSSSGFRFPDGTVQTTAATSSGGTITGVTAGAGLTGGGNSGTPIVSVGAGTGLSVADDSISVNYGSAVGTAVEGNKSITINTAAGSGLSGGDQVILGAGGSLALLNIDKGSSQNIFKHIGDVDGVPQLSAITNDDTIRFAGSGGTNVTFYSQGSIQKVIIDSSGIASSQWANGTGSGSINYASGKVGIGTTDPSEKLEINGNLKLTGTGNITATGTVDAFNVRIKYQDLAEWVPSSERILAGTVVVLDTNKSNQVVSSTQAYDTRVAGVVSEQPGIALGERGTGKVLVATTGRVLVKVDATNAPIHIGDLLVTSDIPGLAMKSEPITIGNRKIHTPGTLIGKALEPLEKGSGKILVLLSLQ